MESTERTAPDVRQLQLQQLPIELQVMIFERLHCMQTVNNLRAASQHFKQVFANSRRAILKAQEQKLLHNLLRYHYQMHCHMGLPLAFKWPSPSWDLVIPGKSSFLLAIVSQLPLHVDATHVRFTNESGFRDLTKLGASDHQEDVRLLSCLTDSENHPHLINLTGWGVLIIDTMNADFLVTCDRQWLAVRVPVTQFVAKAELNVRGSCDISTGRLVSIEATYTGRVPWPRIIDIEDHEHYRRILLRPPRPRPRN